MTIVLLPVVVVGALLAWAAGVRVRHVLAGSAVAALLLLVGAVVLGVALPDGDDDENDVARPSRPVDEVLEVTTDVDDFARPIRPIGDLDDGTTRMIEVVGLPADRRAYAMQCVAEAAHCEPSVPIRADEDGRAVFLFEFTTCPASQCTLTIVDEHGERRVSSTLVFGGGAGEGSVALNRSTQLAAGEMIEVELTGFQPGAVTVTYCTPPGPIEPGRCGAPAPEVTATIDASGRALVPLPVHTGPVGRDRAECGRGHPCAVAVAGRPDVAVATVAFAGSADAQPRTAQVVIGLSVAAALLVLAYVLSRRGPWEPPDGDPFAGITLDDPFKDLDLEPDDIDAQPATSRRTKARAPTAVTITT